MGGRGGSSHIAAHTGGFSDARSFLQNSYGAEHAQAILRILQNSPSYVQQMWDRYASFFRATNEPPNSQSAFYSPMDDSVHLSIRNVARGSSIHPPYATVFHEYGHMTDYLIARENGYGNYTAFTEVYKGGLLGQTAKREMQQHLDRAKRLDPTIRTKTQAARYIINEAKSKYSQLDRSDISDIMEGAGIGVAYPLDTGHGANYWRDRDNGKEIFAEITSAEAAHPGSLKDIKDYFPETYAVYKDMMKELRKNGHCYEHYS